MARRVLMVVIATALAGFGLAMAQDPMETDRSVVGRVIAVTQDEMTIRTDHNQEWKFQLNDQTLRLPGVAVGDHVRVQYKDDLGTTNLALNVSRSDSTYTARTNALEPSPSRMDTDFVEGTVVSSGPTEIVIRTDSGDSRTYVVGSDVDRTHFIVGDRVRLSYHDEGGRMMARQVTPASSTYASNYPDTASSLPLVALLGVLSLLAGSILWIYRGARIA